MQLLACYCVHFPLLKTCAIDNRVTQFQFFRIHLMLTKDEAYYYCMTAENGWRCPEDGASEEPARRCQ